ncbi:hypothetical protein HDU89_001007 [Geranomyces variabilis]|nr:hypothetical protein HDU89_001007 [Geranomyces variabilis]
MAAASSERFLSSSPSFPAPTTTLLGPPFTTSTPASPAQPRFAHTDNKDDYNTDTDPIDAEERDLLNTLARALACETTTGVMMHAAARNQTLFQTRTMFMHLMTGAVPPRVVAAAAAAAGGEKAAGASISSSAATAGNEYEYRVAEFLLRDPPRRDL